jgi:hypothetical protein
MRPCWRDSSLLHRAARGSAWGTLRSPRQELADGSEGLKPSPKARPGTGKMPPRSAVWRGRPPKMGCPHYTDYGSAGRRSAPLDLRGPERRRGAPGLAKKRAGAALAATLFIHSPIKHTAARRRASSGSRAIGSVCARDMTEAITRIRYHTCWPPLMWISAPVT